MFEIVVDYKFTKIFTKTSEEYEMYPSEQSWNFQSVLYYRIENQVVTASSSSQESLAVNWQPFTIINNLGLTIIACEQAFFELDLNVIVWQELDYMFAPNTF